MHRLTALLLAFIVSTLSAHAATVYTTKTQTLTNKTLTSAVLATPIISGNVKIELGANDDTLIWTAPAAARQITFGDPGGNDFVLYGAAAQTITGKTIGVTQLSGVIGAANLDDDLDALAATATTGLYVVTGSGTSTTRSITGTANQITVTNGDGVSGAPTLTLPSAIVFPGTGAFTLPSGTTAQQPADAAGLFRYNSDEAAVEFNNGTDWIVLDGSGGSGSGSPGGNDTEVQFNSGGTDFEGDPGLTYIAADNRLVLAGPLRSVTQIEESDGDVIAEMGVGSATGHLQFDNTANVPRIKAAGSGTNISLSLEPKGTGLIETGSKEVSNSFPSTSYSSNSLVNFSYVNALDPKSRIKFQVVAATTANITLSGTQTIDGIALSASPADRVLVKNQSTGAENGIYIVQSGAWVRDTDLDSILDSALGGGFLVYVRQGTANGNKIFACTNTGLTVDPGTTAMTFAQVGASSGANGDITAMSGLTGALKAPTQIQDSSSNELLIFSATGSAVNEFTVANAATTGRPNLSVTGGDTNIGAQITTKGTGTVLFDNAAGSSFQGVAIRSSGSTGLATIRYDSNTNNAVYAIPNTSGNGRQFMMNISNPTAGAIPYGSSNNSWNVAAAGTNPAVLVTNGTGSAPEWQERVITRRKTADESVTSSTTVQADDHLVAAIPASTNWTFVFDVHVGSANPTPDFKFNISGPTSSTVEFTYTFIRESGTNAGCANLPIAGGTDTTFTMAGGDGNILHITGYCTNSTNAGNITLNWAQNTSDGNATTVQAGSTATFFRQ